MRACCFVRFVADVARGAVAIRRAGGRRRVVRVKETQGPFIIILFTLQEISTASPTAVTVLVQDREASEVLLDAVVNLSFVPPVGTRLPASDVRCDPTNAIPALGLAGAPASSATFQATRDRSDNKLLYGVSVLLRTVGAWQLQVTICQGGAVANVAYPTAVGETARWFTSLWPYLALPPFVIALFVLNQWLRRQSTPEMHSGPAHALPFFLSLDHTRQEIGLRERNR